MISWDEYQTYRISPSIHSDLRHHDIVRQVESFQAAYPEQLTTKLLGESVEGRSITLLTMGTGEKRVLAWSQMHGNEPTHTAALLDVLNFLLTDRQHPTAQAVLSECTLHFVLMLNPDGAQRWTRRNAQDIDINRDALHLQTPEGLILRDTVLQLQPDYALNLHNHRPHTTVGQSQQPASFSLLVPPIDADETDTEMVLKAKRLAGYLAEAVAPYCPGPISRYNADYMPRCFGEWVQQQGAATITIEAGGWSTIEAEPLVQVHFYGLIACLKSIATNSYAEISPTIYESLPRTGEHDLFDKLLRGVTIVNGLGRSPFSADIGINFAQTVRSTTDGTIADLGDLHVTSGKRLIEACDLICIPGQIAWLPRVSPASLPDKAAIKSLLSKGVTTALGLIDTTTDDISDLETLRHAYSSPINLGFLARVTDPSPETLARLVKGISSGLLGVLADGLPTEVRLYLSLFEFPLISEAALTALHDKPASLAECASRTQHCAQLLGFKRRGSICLNAAADLVLLKPKEALAEALAHDDCDLHRVIVGGNVAYEHGEIINSNSGSLLRSPIFENKGN